MLSTAKPVLQQQLKLILGSDETAKIFEDAYLSTLPMDDLDDMDDETAKQNCRKQMEDMAEQFGKLCAAGLASSLSQKLTDAIDTYVKSIDLIITPAALISPVGPVTGAISPAEIQVI